MVLGVLIGERILGTEIVEKLLKKQELKFKWEVEANIEEEILLVMWLMKKEFIIQIHFLIINDIYLFSK